MHEKKKLVIKKETKCVACARIENKRKRKMKRNKTKQKEKWHVGTTKPTIPLYLVWALFYYIITFPRFSFILYRLLCSLKSLKHLQCFVIGFWRIIHTLMFGY